jgi:DNA-binding transcriptional LysR family regulator
MMRSGYSEICPMEMRHLRYFVTVADEMHFSRAAERLNITPPTLTHQIQALERILGAQLFTRKTKKNVELTHFGKDFLEEARAVVKQFEQVERIGRSAARGEAGSITIGYILTAACSGTVATAIVEFKKLHPDVSFDLRKMETVPQMKALIDGTLDVGFIREPRNYPVELSGFVVDAQPPWLALPESHHLAKYEVIEPDMLNGAGVITTQVEMEVGFLNGITAVSSAKIAMQVVARYPDIFSVLNGVAAGFGVAILSQSISRISVPGVVFRKIKNVEKLIAHVLAFRKNERTPGVKAFIDMLRKKAPKPN